MDEYIKYAKPEKNRMHDWLDPMDPEKYRATIAELLLLRKYTSFSDDVYLRKVLDAIEAEYPNNRNKVISFKNELDAIENSAISMPVDNDTSLTLRETVELELYGAYLHADYDKIEKINKTNPILRCIAVRRYVELYADLIIRVADCLRDCQIPKISFQNIEHGNTLRITNTKETKQGIKASPYWEYLYGKDATDEELYKNLLSLDMESLEIFVKALIFLNAIENTNSRLTDIKRMTHRNTRKAWGDFSEVKAFLRNHKNIGLSSYIRFNKAHDVAYVYMLDNVEAGMVIEEYQIIDNATVINLVKDENSWKIYSIGERLEMIDNSVNVLEVLDNIMAKINSALGRKRNI